MWQFIARTGRNVGRPGEAVTSEAGVLLEGVAAGLAARSDSVRLRLGHQVETGDGSREHVRLQQQDRARVRAIPTTVPQSNSPRSRELNSATRELRRHYGEGM